MKKKYFLFGIHCHQPVGNFDFVFQDNFEKAYKPFFDILEKYPEIKIAIHYSGPLLEWIIENRSDFIDKMVSLVKKGQIEFIGGGFYEPILTAISRKDALGQIKKMKMFIENNFHQKPRGLWLAERAWEPHLTSILADAGVEYIFLDDFHFLSSGLPLNKLNGYYITEDNNQTVSVFPISQKLRYLIPFHPVDDVLNFLHSEDSEDESEEATLSILFDDGEKFGTWPGTYDHVYKNNWLEEFFLKLSSDKNIEFILPGECLNIFDPLGLVYLPTGAYMELTEWVLPTPSRIKLENFIESLSEEKKLDELAGLVRGGFWRNYFSKYSESNYMSKRVNYLSRKIDNLFKKDYNEILIREAMNEVWKAQCNCAYWHGIFGGIYLPHLRSAIYRHLLRAEDIISKVVYNDKKWLDYEILDIDSDGNQEIVIGNSRMTFVISPDRGGSFLEISDRISGVNFANFITRREEAYHRLLFQTEKYSDEEYSTIHDIVKSKEDNLVDYLIYDKHPLSVIFEVFGNDSSSGDPLTDSVIFDSRTKNTKCVIDRLITPYSGEYIDIKFNTYSVNDISLKKNLRIYRDENRIEVLYDLIVARENEFVFYMVFPVFIPEGENPKRYFSLNSQEKKFLPSTSENFTGDYLLFTDEIEGFNLSINSDRECDIKWYPLYTVNQSEGGFEKNIQGSMLFFGNKIKPGGKYSFKYNIRFDTEEG